MAHAPDGDLRNVWSTSRDALNMARLAATSASGMAHARLAIACARRGLGTLDSGDLVAVAAAALALADGLVAGGEVDRGALAAARKHIEQIRIRASAAAGTTCQREDYHTRVVATAVLCAIDAAVTGDPDRAAAAVFWAADARVNADNREWVRGADSSADRRYYAAACAELAPLVREHLPCPSLDQVRGTLRIA